MTDRHTGYIVTLEREIREDDAEHIINAMRMLKGVVDVQPIVSDFQTTMAESKAKHELRMKLFDVLK